MTKFADPKLNELYAQREAVNRAIRNRHKQLEDTRLRQLSRTWLARHELTEWLASAYASSKDLSQVDTSIVHDELRKYLGRNPSNKRISALMKEIGFVRRSKRVGARVIKSYQRP